MSHLLKSFIDVAPESHFPIQNLPFGIFKPGQERARVGVAIGEFVLDLSVLEELGHFQGPEFQGRPVFSEDALNGFLSLGRPAWKKAREVIQKLLAAETS
ncbi:MAG: fumarylacetoacetase, partial [Verrucomicrobia bacterium]